MNLGGILNKILDTFLPDIVGDVLGAALDAVTGNFTGAATNALDMVEDVLEYCGAEGAAKVLDDVLGYAKIATSLMGGDPSDLVATVGEAVGEAAAQTAGECVVAVGEALAESVVQAATEDALGFASDVLGFAGNAIATVSSSDGAQAAGQVVGFARAGVDLVADIAA